MSGREQWTEAARRSSEPPGMDWRVLARAVLLGIVVVWLPLGVVTWMWLV